MQKRQKGAKKGIPRTFVFFAAPLNTCEIPAKEADLKNLS
jgi:hypothetical protein